MKLAAGFTIALLLFLLIFLLNAIVPQMVHSFIELRNQLP